MVVKRSKKSLLRTILIIIVRSVLSVSRTIKIAVCSIRTRLKKPVKKAERKARDQKLGSSLAKYPLFYEDTDPDYIKKLTKEIKKSEKKTKRNSRSSRFKRSTPSTKPDKRKDRTGSN